MSIKKTTETSWDRTFPAYIGNDSHEIEVTKDGIVIDYDLLSWDEIDEARKIISANVHVMAAPPSTSQDNAQR